VGLIQRAVEAAGIATISITFSKEITRKVRPPRAVFTNLPLGHPLGFPDQRFRQIQILRLLLKYLNDIESPGTIIDLDLTQSDDPVTTCSVCGV
jgi:D-proline reductase (dithiol) PrdB